MTMVRRAQHRTKWTFLPTLRVLTVSLSVLLMARLAAGDVVRPLGLLTDSLVPANGVLQFSTDDGLSIRVISSDGTEVEGSLVRPGVWRPSTPFAVGQYTADVDYEANPERAEDKDFEVVPAVEFDPGVVQVSVSTTVASTNVAEEACCEMGAARVDGVVCENECKPLCVPAAFDVQQVVDVYVDRDWDHVLAWQIELTNPTETQPGYYGMGSWPVEGEPDELCGMTVVFNWLNEETIEETKCIRNPKPELDPIRESPTSFGDITECTIPPIGFELEWCTAQG
jgi:hypothetical protein